MEPDKKPDAGQTPLWLCRQCHYKLNSDTDPGACPHCDDETMVPITADDHWMEDKGL